MAKFDIIMPKLGESIIEATITRWLKAEGDMITEDEVICELATDKVDSEIPSPVEGKLIQILCKEGEVVPVGQLIAIIDMEGENAVVEAKATPEAVPDKGPAPVVEAKATPEAVPEKGSAPVAEAKATPEAVPDVVPEPVVDDQNIAEATSDRFYSPLVKSIAKQENISAKELELITGSGKEGRVTKEDILEFLKNRTATPTPVSASAPQKAETTTPPPAAQPSAAPVSQIKAPTVTASTGDQIVEMDRMRRLIADHMVMSTHVSPHVTMFHEVDMNRIVNWRNKMKDVLQKRDGEKLTFTPFFMEAAAKALKEFPGVNASVDGYNIILRKHINIGMAAALPSGNLIVPVIKDADQKNLLGLTKTVNDLAERARNNKLSPDDIQGGTFTITNFGQFGSLTGSPIINQPNAAIMGLGTIHKQPVVIETPEGDVIAIRQRMILSLAFDHRIVDGALGGKFLKRVAEILENFDENQTI
jgi:2-oxoglutarate dehydrogenase E2 component (dihydrolipoamide succinyltransferase)